MQACVKVTGQLLGVPEIQFRSSRFCGKAFYALHHLTGPEMSFLFVFACCNKVSCIPGWPEFAMELKMTLNFSLSCFYILNAGLQTCVSNTDLCNSGGKTQGFAYAGPAC